MQLKHSETDQLRKASSDAFLGGVLRLMQHLVGYLVTDLTRLDQVLNHSIRYCGIVLGYVLVCVKEREENLEHLGLFLLHRQGQLLSAASLVPIFKVASELLALAMLAP